MTIKLYHFPMSGPSRGAMLAAKLFDVPIEIEVIDLFKKDQLKESFVKINPQHCVPTLDDDGFILWESRAIVCYLAEKYGKDDRYYPKDLKKRAVVHQRLYFDCSTLYVKIEAIYYPILFLGVTEIKQHLKDDLNNTLGYLEKFLTDSKWVAGDHVTIADTSIYATITSVLSFGWDVSSFPNIERWLKQCSCLPGATENEIGAKAFGEVVKMNLRQQ